MLSNKNTFETLSFGSLFTQFPLIKSFQRLGGRCSRLKPQKPWFSNSKNLVVSPWFFTDFRCTTRVDSTLKKALLLLSRGSTPRRTASLGSKPWDFIWKTPNSQQQNPRFLVDALKLEPSQNEKSHRSRPPPFSSKMNAPTFGLYNDGNGKQRPKKQREENKYIVVLPQHHSIPKAPARAHTFRRENLLRSLSGLPWLGQKVRITLTWCKLSS